jgi:putative ABC transport system substrate-binding protein
MINRRAFLRTLSASLFAAPLAVEAQQAGKVCRIGLIGVDAAEGAGHVALRQGLRALGYEEGKNLLIEYRGAEGQYDRLPALSAELVRLKVDVLVTSSTPGALAAKQATTTVPVVVAIIGDAVAAGIVPSLARQGGNITGSQFHYPDIMVKRLELLREAAPRLVRIVVAFNPANLSIGPALKALEATARPINVELQPVGLKSPQDFDGVLAVLAQRRADAFIIADDPMLRRAHARAFADLAIRWRAPSIGDGAFVNNGGLLAYSVNRLAVWRRAAFFVDRILKGADPGELPFEQIDRIDVAINLKTAKAIGLTIPPSLLLRADQIIE